MKRIALLSLFVMLAATACSRSAHNDTAITSNVEQQLSSERLNGAVAVSTDKGIVTLTGVVPDPGAKQRAEIAAKRVSGVHNVINNLRTTMAADAPVARPPDIPPPAMNPPRGIEPQNPAPGNIPPGNIPQRNIPPGQ